MNPCVSVVLPTYNRARILKRAVDSVLNQTFTNFELIIVDDCSQDNTEDIIATFSDPRIKYIKHKINRGGCAARNTGIINATGKYIAFQDSDDEWLPTKLEKQVTCLKNVAKDVGLVYTGFYQFKGDIKRYSIPSYIKKEGHLLDTIVCGSHIGPQVMLITKECLENIGLFDEALPRLQDWELVIRLSQHYQIKCIDEPLVNQYIQYDSITKNTNAMFKAIQYMAKKHFNNSKMSKKIISDFYFTCFAYSYSERRILYGFYYLIKSLKAHPINTINKFVHSLLHYLHNDFSTNYFSHDYFANS